GSPRSAHPRARRARGAAGELAAVPLLELSHHASPCRGRVAADLHPAAPARPSRAHGAAGYHLPGSGSTLRGGGGGSRRSPRPADAAPDARGDVLRSAPGRRMRVGVTTLALELARAVQGWRDDPPRAGHPGAGVSAERGFPLATARHRSPPGATPRSGDARALFSSG